MQLSAGGAASVIPLGFAFGAGMVSAVNPCGFAMLLAYLGLYLGAEEKARGGVSSTRWLARALLVGESVTVGFVVLFGLAGAAIAGGARPLVPIQESQRALCTQRVYIARKIF